MNKFCQWILAVIVDSRVDLNSAMQLTKGSSSPNIGRSVLSQEVLEELNTILRAILDDKEVYLAWTGRHRAIKIGIGKQRKLEIPSLYSFSSGQATLFGIFGTLLFYGDSPRWGGRIPTDEIVGICIIDEVDAHMHVDLQHRALPSLIHMFPKVQFILSSHSPLFVLGMEKAFGAAGVSVVELPSAKPIPAEAYAEFGRALEALRDTKAFADAIVAIAGHPGKVVVLLEGETDSAYFNTAAKLLNREPLLDMVEFRWVGDKDPKGGQGFHTGKNALNHAVDFLRAMPTFVKRRFIALYDNEVNKPDGDYELVHIRSLPKNPNGRAEVGIENMLPPEAIPDKMYEQKKRARSDGGMSIIKTLNKTRLCEHVCESRRNPADFERFIEVFDMIEELAKPRPTSEATSTGEPIGQ